MEEGFLIVVFRVDFDKRKPIKHNIKYGLLSHKLKL